MTAVFAPLAVLMLALLTVHIVKASRITAQSDSLSRFAHPTLVALCGSRDRFLRYSVVLSALAVFLGLSFSWLYSTPVSRSSGFIDFFERSGEYATEHLWTAETLEVVLPFLGGSLVVLFILWWVAGDLMGGVGGPISGHRSFFHEISRNRRRTWVLLLMSGSVVFLIGYLGAQVFEEVFQDGARDGLFEMVWGGGTLLLWVLLGLILVTFSGRICSRFLGVTEPSGQQLVLLGNCVEEMGIASSMPGIAFGVVHSPVPNAFAFGIRPSESRIVVTDSLLGLLSRDELQAVLAHEFGHIQNRDILFTLFALGVIYTILILSGISTVVLFAGIWVIAGTLAICGALLKALAEADAGESPGCVGLVVILAIAATGIGFGIMLISFSLGCLVILGIALLFGAFISSGISKRREYLADAMAVRYTRQAAPLASALKKLSGEDQRGMRTSFAFVAPLMFSRCRFERGIANGLVSVFYRTHPPIALRIARLEHMGGGSGPLNDEHP